MGYPWINLNSWQPFQVDALGLITLLGGDEINTWVGRLVPSRWLEYMPLLAINVVAANQLLNKQPSFILYNVTKGIHTTDAAAWFTRWIQCQDTKVNRTVVCWEAQPETPKSWNHHHIISAGISFCFTGFLVVLTVLSRDFYGLAAVCALIVSIFAKAYLLSANRSAIDRAITQPSHPTTTDKLLILTPDANVLTMWVPGNLIVPIFVRNPVPSYPKLYDLVRYIDWGAFCIQVVTLGQAVLATQMYTTVLIVVPSVLLCRGFGCEDTVSPCKIESRKYGRTKGYTCWIGSRLKATVFEWPDCMEFTKADTKWVLRDPADIALEGVPTRRMDMFAWLDLTEEEKDSLSRWGLLPHRREGNTSWQEEFRAKSGLIREARVDIWDIQNDVVRAIEGGKGGMDDVEGGVASAPRDAKGN